MIPQNLDQGNIPCFNYDLSAYLNCEGASNIQRHFAHPENPDILEQDILSVIDAEYIPILINRAD